MPDAHFYSYYELVNKLKSVTGLTLGEADVNHVFYRTIGHPKITGIAGDVIEQSVLGYPADSDQRPDLDVDGVPTELKTTGIRRKNGVFEAKEPCSITAVSIDTISGEEFSTSNFWHKAENLLFVFYEYESDITVRAAAYADFHIRGFYFNQFTRDEVTILHNDWQLVHDYVADVQATKEKPELYYPLISTDLNTQLVYLDTAPKYPHSPRFRLRKRVVTLIVQRSFDKQLESIPGKYLTYTDLYRKCHEVYENYVGKTIGDICDLLNVSKKTTKSLAEAIVTRMFGAKSASMSKIELFQRFGVVGKSIVLTKEGKPTEDMKLLPVDFDELSDPEAVFENSKLYNYFHDNTFLCIVFEEPYSKAPYTENVFKGLKFLRFSEKFIQAFVRRTWEDARDIILSGHLKAVVCHRANGDPIINKNGVMRIATNLPKSRMHLVFFRGTGNDSRNKISVMGVEMLRQNYWIKGGYIAEQLKQIPFV